MCTIVVAWTLIDQATKLYFNGFQVGSVISSPIPGVLDFVLVHNTGAAWGMLDDMTSVLAVVSVIVCVLGVIYVIFVPDLSAFSVAGIGLIVAGGVGNLIDRLTMGYVVDFISASFIDFPVFNIADVGVTCGVVIFIASTMYEMIHGKPEQKS